MGSCVSLLLWLPTWDFILFTKCGRLGGSFSILSLRYILGTMETS